MDMDEVEENPNNEVEFEFVRLLHNCKRENLTLYLLIPNYLPFNAQTQIIYYSYPYFPNYLPASFTSYIFAKPPNGRGGGGSRKSNISF